VLEGLLGNGLPSRSAAMRALSESRVGHAL
jgi:hypothetical protein